MKLLKDRVLKYITDYASKAYPADRYQMAKFFQTSEREIRETIKALRKMKKPICSSSSEGGYWMAESWEDYLRFKAEYGHRAVDVLDTVRQMDEGAQEMFGGQVGMDVDL